MERQTIEVKIVGLGRKWGDFSALDSYLYYFEDDWFCEKVYPDAFDNGEVINVVDEDVEFCGREEGCVIEHEFEIEVDQEILDNAETAKDFYKSYVTKINVFDLFTTYRMVSSFEFADGNVFSVL